MPICEIRGQTGAATIPMPGNVLGSVASKVDHRRAEDSAILAEQLYHGRDLHFVELAPFHLPLVVFWQIGAQALIFAEELGEAVRREDERTENGHGRGILAEARESARLVNEDMQCPLLFQRYTGPSKEERVQVFEFPMESCDVVDRATLAQFRDKLIEWDTLLNRDPQHSIANQFGDMLWQDAAWRSANFARSFTKDEGPNASVSPLLGSMLDRGYVTGQIIAITRLLEKSPDNQPKKAVISLRRLVDELRAARPLFTRENFVAHDGLPYDFEPVRDREYAKIAEAANPEGTVYTYLATTGPEGWGMAEAQHKFFDRLSGVGPQARSRSDLITVEVLDRMDASLNDALFDDIRTMRHKGIAHAADAISRNAAGDIKSGLTLNDFDRAHYLLSGVYQAISVIVLGQWRGSGVPVPQHNIFEHCDQPFIATHHIGDVQQFWKSHSDEREAFLHNAFKDIVPERQGC